MILEGLVTTLNEDASINLAPQGAKVAEDFLRLVLRPFATSRTHANLLRTRKGVFHVTDDAELIARAAIGQLEEFPPTRRTPAGDAVLTDACRWYAFRIVEVVDQDWPRSAMLADVTASGTQREFFGFNRAKHAVVEAAILATRVAFLEPQAIRDEFARLRPLVDKTGGPAEARGFELLWNYVQESIGP